MAVVAVIAAAAIVVASRGSSKSASPTTTKTPTTAARSARQILAAASARTRAAGTARMSMVETVSGSGVSFDLNLNGASDYAHKNSEITMSALGRDFETVRVVSGVSYMSAPGVALPGNAHWVSLRPSDLGLPSNQSALGSNDPNTGLQYLSAISGSPHDLGAATIDGAPTTHYGFTVDLRSLMDQMSRGMSKLGGQSLGLGEMNGLLDLTNIPAEAWIDHDGRVRQFKFTLAMSTLGQSVKAVSTMKYSHFDEPLTITAPAPTDVVPFSSVPQFFQQLGQNAASNGFTA
ncbi:MAG TPA: hypothetical protein VH914_05565 [Acidimicrobiia bacterium]|nr:hypothetical protein [Acidimicrobiia bacterium]